MAGYYSVGFLVLSRTLQPHVFKSYVSSQSTTPAFPISFFFPSTKLLTSPRTLVEDFPVVSTSCTFLRPSRAIASNWQTPISSASTFSRIFDRDHRRNTSLLRSFSGLNRNTKQYLTRLIGRYPPRKWVDITRHLLLSSRIRLFTADFRRLSSAIRVLRFLSTLVYNFFLLTRVLMSTC